MAKKEVVAKNPTKSSKPVPGKEKTSFFKRITRFFKDLRGETKRVVWPSKKQVKNNAFVVLGFMVVAAIFVWGLDALFTAGMSLIFG